MPAAIWDAACSLPAIGFAPEANPNRLLEVASARKTVNTPDGVSFVASKRRLGDGLSRDARTSAAFVECKGTGGERKYFARPTGGMPWLDSAFPFAIQASDLGDCAPVTW